MVRNSCLSFEAKGRRSSFSGLKGRLLSGVKVRRARSFSGQEKHKPTPVKGTKEDTATLSDTEGYSKSRRPPRRRTTGGSEIADDVTRAKMSGYSSEPEGAHGTLNRQQIIAMVKQRFGLNATGNPTRQNATIQEERGPPSPSSPKQIRYDRLLEQPGAYPTLPRKEDAPQPVNTPGVIYLQLGDEIRRAMIPTNMNKIDQVHNLFENTFTEKFKREHNNNRKTIYIKDPSCGIFYELEDVSDLSNKTHLKILDSAPPKPIQNGPVSKPVTSASVTYNAPSAVHVQKEYLTSTPLPNHSHVRLTDPMQSGQGSFQWKTTVTEKRTIDGKPQSVTRTAVSQGNLMDKKKVPLPGLGAQLSPEKRRASKDQAVEDQLDTLTSMLQDALTKTESLDSLPVRTDSPTSSQSSMAEHGPPEGNGVHHTLGIISPNYMYRSRLRSDSGAESMSDTPPTPPEVKPKPAHHLPTPPPRASSKNVSRESSIKYSQTLQRDSPKRNISQQYGTLPLPSSSATKQQTVRSIAVESTPIATSRRENLQTVSRGSPVHVRYEGDSGIDKSKLKSKANDLKGDIQILRAQLGQLKHIHSYQAKSFEEMMKNAKQQILSSMQKLTTAIEDSPQRTARNNVHEEEMKYMKAKNEINRTISELESEVEMVRLDVIQKRSIGNPVEIDGMNSQLAVISRQIADLRSQFTEIHDSMKMVMASELDVIVQGDKFLKEEPSKLDNLVSRCKHVTGTLFTLQKLMSAQEQMKSESQISFSSLDEVDKDLIDSIRSSHLQSTPSSVHEDTRIKNRPRVRFCDEVN